MKSAIRSTLALAGLATLTLACWSVYALFQPHPAQAAPAARAYTAAPAHPAMQPLTRLTDAMLTDPETSQIADRLAWVESLITIGEHDRARAMFEQIMNDGHPEKYAPAFQATLDAMDQ